MNNDITHIAMNDDVSNGQCVVIDISKHIIVYIGAIYEMPIDCAEGNLLILSPEDYTEFMEYRRNKIN